MIVTGPDNTCSSANFSINLPAGATVVWSISNPAIATIPANSTSPTVTVTKVGEKAIVTLTATVTHCTFTYAITKNIQIGTAQTPTIQPPVYYGNEAGLTALFIPGATYNWYENNVLTEQNGTNTYVAFVPCNSSKTIAVEAVNSCGISIQARRGLTVSCGGAFTVAPNPAQGDFTVKINDENQINKEIKEVLITDKAGQVRKKQKYPEGTKLVKLDTSSLEPDIYVLRIFDGKSWYHEKFIVQ